MIRLGINVFSKLLLEYEEFHIGNIEILTLPPYKTEYKGIRKLFIYLEKKKYKIDVVKFTGLYDDKIVNQMRMRLQSWREGKTDLILAGFFS